MRGLFDGSGTLVRFLNRRAAPAWCLFGLAFLVRLAAIRFVFRAGSYFSDERHYLRLADTIAHGDLLMGIEMTLAPGPVYLLALGRALGLGPFGLRTLQALLVSGAVAIAFLAARRIFGPRLAGLAALVAAGYPYLIYITGVFYGTSLCLFTLSLTIYSLLRFIQEGGARWLVLAGVALGVSVLAVAPMLIVSLVLALWLLIHGRGGLLRRTASVAALALVTLAVILPWTARNYVVSKRFVLVSSRGTWAFYWVNNATIDPFDRNPEPWFDRYYWPVVREQARQALTDDDLERELLRRAGLYIARQPARALRNYLVRLSMFFDPAPRLWTTNVHSRSRATTMVAVVTSLPVLLAAPLGLWFGRRRFRLWFPLPAMTLLSALAYALFQVSVRYRLPFEPWFILFAVVGVVGTMGPRWFQEETGAPAQESDGRP